MLRLLTALACLVALPGCAMTNARVEVRVERADRVALEHVGMTTGPFAELDFAHPTTVLPEGSAPRVETARYRTSTVPTRRNEDGSIDLLLWNGVWPLVRADGTVTILRDDAFSLPVTGTAWAFLASPPAPLGGRMPWGLRLVTPRDNVRDARLLVRRDRASGAIFLAASALLLGYGTGCSYAATRASGGVRTVPLVLGVTGLVGAALAGSEGLYLLLLREHDETLTSPAGER